MYNLWIAPDYAFPSRKLVTTEFALDEGVIKADVVRDKTAFFKSPSISIAISSNVGV